VEHASNTVEGPQALEEVEEVGSAFPLRRFGVPLLHLLVSLLT
jgi:hypothetical protein